MNREDIIRMACEVLLLDERDSPNDDGIAQFIGTLTDFAALVAAAKDAEHKEAMRWDIHSCGPTCKRYACVATREAVAAEREACAKVCDELHYGLATERAAEIIRARGETE